jgi:hypothetical protein
MAGAGRWKRKPRVPLGLRAWPESAVDLLPGEVVRMYDLGYAGTLYQPEEREALYDNMPFPDGEKAAYDFGLVGSGAGKLSLPYLYSYANWPRMWPCPGQATGDCVGHAGKNAGLVLLGVDVAFALPDEATGKVEGFPEISELGERQGVIACENIYGDRGHSGQGASCDRLIRHVTEWGGIMLRQNYPDLGIDLEKYNVSLSIGWGRGGTPEKVKAEARKHQIRTATDCPNHEVVRDFCANGYPNWACSGMGWSSQRDANGYSRRQGSWSHSWITMGYDDRPVTVGKYGFPLALYNHDWGKWNGGPRDILESSDYVPAHLREAWIANGLVSEQTGNLLIPEGSMWIDARLLDKCDCTAMSSFNGFPVRDLDNSPF